MSRTHFLQHLLSCELCKRLIETYRPALIYFPADIIAHTNSLIKRHYPDTLNERNHGTKDGEECANAPLLCVRASQVNGTSCTLPPV